MSSSIYQPWSVTVGEQPTTAYWNLLGSNDASFNTGQGFNDDIILWRHLSNDIIASGVILPFAGASVPSNQWLVCDGSQVSRATYAALFAVCGTAYGAGDGSTTFNLPNLSGRVPVGLNSSDGNFSTLGQMGGEDYHTLSWDEMPVHNHGVNDPGHSHRVSYVGTSGSYGWLDSQHASSSGNAYTSGSGTGISIQNAGSGWGHNNLQPYTTVNYIIKT